MPERPLVDTPALVIDLDVVERNIAAMQAHADAHGVALRPHVKTHKLPQLAHLQLAAGAVGVCDSQTVAEGLVARGIDALVECDTGMGRTGVSHPSRRSRPTCRPGSRVTG